MKVTRPKQKGQSASSSASYGRYSRNNQSGTGLWWKVILGIIALIVVFGFFESAKKNENSKRLISQATISAKSGDFRSAEKLFVEAYRTANDKNAVRRAMISLFEIVEIQPGEIATFEIRARQSIVFGDPFICRKERTTNIKCGYFTPDDDRYIFPESSGIVVSSNYGAEGNVKSLLEISEIYTIGNKYAGKPILSFRSRSGNASRVYIVTPYLVSSMTVEIEIRSPALLPNPISLPNADITGGDFDSRGVKGVNIEECASICIGIDSCIGFSWVRSSKWCWPKKIAGPQVGRKGVTSAVLRQ